MPSKLLSFTQPAAQADLRDSLSDHVVFHSPVRDYHGPADVAHILTTIGEVLDRIEAQGELVDGPNVVTILSAAHAHDEMSGVLYETHDALGRVESATLLLRPLSALLEAITAMRTALEQSPLPSTGRGRST